MDDLMNEVLESRMKIKNLLAENKALEQCHQEYVKKYTEAKTALILISEEHVELKLEYDKLKSKLSSVDT